MSADRVARPAAAVVAALLALGLGACGGDESASPPSPRAEERTPEAEPRPSGDSSRGKDGLLRSTSGRPQVETVATGLDTPWEIAFLPDGRALVTERPGRLRLLSKDGRLRPEPVAEVPIAEIGEGGLLGLAVDPRFRTNRFVYLYRTTQDEIEILRYRLEDDELRDEQKIAGGIAVGPIHDSGRLRFGPDERLYINTGDAGNPQLAQDPRSLNGKTLRMDPADYRGEGGRPEVFTLGHRNGQGLDWQPGTGKLFEAEHGEIGNDEVNVLREGANYGWPQAEGRDHGGRFQGPLVLYEEGIAPSGASFAKLPGSAWTGDLFVAALRGEQLRRIDFEDGRVVRDEPLFLERFGRLRTVTEGPDGALYVLTSNQDGRGEPTSEDDRILRIVPPAS
ncbi:PQQ-dependent sugar dehydrogenase [soil metagenome]